MDTVFFGIQKMEVFLLVLTRSAGIFTLTPVFGGNQTPVHLRVAIALGLAFVLVPIASVSTDLPTEFLPLMLLVVREAIVGLVIGFVVSMVFASIQTAGNFVDAQTGFAFASMVDPVNGTQTSLAGHFYHMLAVLLFLITNGHHAMIRALVDSFQLVPLGQFTMPSLLADGILDLFVTLFIIAIRIAAPVVAAVFLADIALAVLSRVVPQMNVLVVGLPLKLGVGLVGMIIALPVLASSSGSLFGDIPSYVAGLLKFAAGP